VVLAVHAIVIEISCQVMPPGIYGTETYRQSLKICPDHRAIVLSDFALSEWVANAPKLGAGAYVREPVILEQLARAVRKELGRATAASHG
jgi:DNA-binding NarL/FixJ family response regulator